ncbi:MAG: hypothetical protein ACRECO_20345 [Xanthobacteraceae bacterium]
MTAATSQAPVVIRPGRIWYLVAVLIAVAGWVGMAMVLFSGISGSAERMIRVLVPGQAELTLGEQGSYTIFHEYRSTLDGRVYNVEGVSGLQVTVREKGTGTTVPLTSSASSNYTIGSYAGRSLFNFEVRRPGVYVLAASYDRGRTEPQTVLAIDRGFVGNLIATILLAFGSAFGGMALGIATFIIVFVKRRRARAAAAPA